MQNVSFLSSRQLCAMGQGARASRPNEQNQFTACPDPIVFIVKSASASHVEFPPGV